MASLTELERINLSLLEPSLREGILQRIAAGLPQITDYSPNAPHVVEAEAFAWAGALLLYYAQRQPEAVEEWVLRELYGEGERPAQPARASVVLSFSSPAPLGGRTIPSGSTFNAPGLVFETLQDYTYPAGVQGDETSGGRPLYPIPVRCQTPGAAGNVPAGAINAPGSLIAGLTGVTNPEPATGGSDAETYAEFRERVLKAPVDEKLITQYDYERFLAEYLGGGRVYVIRYRLPDGSPDPNWVAGRARVSVLNPDGTPLATHPALLAELQRRNPQAVSELFPPAVTAVNVNATLVYTASAVSASDLVGRATQAVREYLTPQAWGRWGLLPNKVYRSEIIKRLQSLPGVVAVELLSPNADVDLAVPYAAARWGTLTFNTVQT